VVVALDLSPAHEDIAERVLHAAKQLLHHHPQARVSCVAVLPPEAGSRALAQLLALRAWGLRLGLREDRLSFVILQNSDAATALLEFCAANATDQILLGAGLARLGAVAGAVAAQARCSVSLIRAPQLE
jgi:eukaryotic-like serine/threonine-protein kinase